MSCVTVSVCVTQYLNTTDNTTGYQYLNSEYHDLSFYHAIQKSADSSD